MSKIVVSIIICTYNRAEYLSQTLASLAGVCVPAELPAELIVVDNGSTDGTAELVKNYALPNMPVRYLPEPQKGKSRGLNQAMAQAEGRIFLFSDDDLRFPENWIAGMCEPILAGRAEAVAGTVALAPHLLREWMEQKHRCWLADTGDVAGKEVTRMTGANMAFAKKVLEKVPQFDMELGPGTLGSGEETLFTYQLREAGYRVDLVLDACVEHHFEEKRLLQAYFLSCARSLGRGEAYIAYHWKHQPAVPALRLLRQGGRSLYRHLRRIVQRSGPEGLPEWEMDIVNHIAFDRQMRIESRRPRSYAKFGLVKLTDTAPEMPIRQS